MARIYGELGAEEALIDYLREHGVIALGSLEAVETHIKTSEGQLHKLREERIQELARQIATNKASIHAQRAEVQQLRDERRKELLQELEKLNQELAIPIPKTRNPFKWIYWRIQRRQKKARKFKLDTDFTNELDRPFRNRVNRLKKLEDKTLYQETNFESIIDQQMQPDIRNKQRIDQALEKAATWVSGARGECETLKVLATLSDNYYVVNNVRLRLNPPMKTDEGLCFACQADHVVIGPQGVFNVETKNWSPQSIQSFDHRSPIEQVRTTGKAIWREINFNIRNGVIRLNKHHWGDKSIRVRNIVSMVGALPKHEFQGVKILPVNRLSGYIQYFDLILTEEEIEEIAEWIWIQQTKSE